MKKLKSIFTLILCILTMGIFYGCTEGGKVEFTTQSIEIVKGETVNLSDYIRIEDTSLDKVRFSSSDDEIVYITLDGKFGAVNIGQVIISAEVGNSTAYMTVKVISESVTLDKPLGLKYDTLEKAVVWNAVYAKVGQEVFTANSYTVWSQKEGEEPVIVSDVLYPKFEIENEGTYTIKVKTNGRSESIKGSDYCQPITVTKLAKPTDLNYDIATSTLTWEGTADEYAVSVNGVRYNSTNKSLKINLNKSGAYTISVISLSNEENATIIEAESQSITLNRLEKPAMAINGGRLEWNLQAGVSEYELKISRDSNPDVIKNLANNVSSYTLQGLTAGTYVVTLTAKPQANYLVSEKSNDVVAVKLASASLTFDKTNKQLKILETLTNPVDLVITKSNGDTENATLNSANAYTYNWAWIEADTYRITATVRSNTASQIVSDVSNTIQITQLAQNSIMEHTAKSDGKSYLKFDSIIHANHYEIELFKTGAVTGTGIKTVDTFNADGYELGVTNDLFNEAGIYNLRVTATSTEALGEGEYILSSSQGLTIERLPNVSGVSYVSEDSEKYVTWNNVVNKTQYSYEFLKNSSVYLSDVVVVIKSFDVASMPFGNYEFKIKAIGNGQTTLDSLSFSSVTFSLTQQLQTPEMTFDKSTNCLKIFEVENVTEYIISLGNNLFETLGEIDGYATIDISSEVENAGIYTFTVQAKNVQDELLLDSVIGTNSTVIIERLAKPVSITLNVNESITVEEYADQTKLAQNKYSLLINNEAITKLHSVENHSIKVKYLAKLEPVGNIYYLDSMESHFTINRLPTPFAPTFVNQNIVWSLLPDEYQGYTCILEISQDNKSFALNMNNETNISATDTRIANNIDLSKQFSISLKYQLGQIVITDEANASSLVSTSLSLAKLPSATNLKIVGTESDIDIVWDAVANAESYVLTITNPDQSVLSQTLTTNHYDQHSFADAGVYTVKVDVKNASYIHANTSQIIMVERLAKPTTVNISNTEDFSINDRPSNTKLEQIKVEIDVGSGKNPVEGNINFTSVASNFTLYAKYIAKQFESGNQYYLSSDTTTYHFERIGVMSAVNIYEGNITWITCEDADGYELKFSKIGKEDKFLKISNKFANSISLSDDTVAGYLTSLGSGTFTISVRALKNAVNNLSSSAVGYLSCQTYSTPASITKLLAPTNVTLSTTVGDIAQTTVTISWDHEEIGTTDKYEIYSGNELLATVIGEKEKTISDAFMASGEYSITVKAIGTENNMTSDTSTPLQFKRLTTPTQISATKNALVSWQTISGAESYELYYQLPFGEVLHLNTINPKNISEIIANGDDKFDGITVINVRAIGNGTTRLSSPLSEGYNVEVLKKPSLTLYPEKLVVAGEYLEAQSVRAKVTIKKISGEIIVLDHSISVGEDFTYPSLEVGEYVAEAYISSMNTTGFVDSVKISKRFTKLATPDDLHFIRTVQSNNETYISFRARTILNAQGYSFSLGTYNQVDYSTILFEEVEYLNYELKDDIQNALKVGANTFSVHAVGGEREGVFYINSENATLTAKMLAQNQNLRTQNGKLTWVAPTGSESFKLIINGDYKDVTSIDNAQTVLEDYVGELSINVKSIGNVQTTKTSENVSLDGIYIGEKIEGAFVLLNYSCTKLDIPSYFAVNDGYITVVKDQNVSSYEFTVNSKTYSDVSQIRYNSIGGITYSYLMSDAMYSDLSVGTDYEIKIRAISNDDAVLNSNLSNKIDILIPTGISEVNWSLRLKNVEGGSSFYDLSDSYINWADLDTGYGYVMLVDDTLLTTSVNEYSPKELTSDGFTFKVAVRGSSEVTSSGSYILNSKFTRAYSYYILGESEISIKDGIINWKRVDNATGYYVYLNGNIYNNTALNATQLDVPSAGNYTVSVQAVSTTASYFAGKKVDYKIEDEIATVKKLCTPSPFLVENGRLYWNEDISLSGAETPWTYDISNLFEQNLTLNFTSGYSIYSIEVNALAFLNINQLTIATLEAIAQSSGMSELFNLAKTMIKDPTGWPTKVFLFDELADNVPAGEYNLTVRQNGNDTNYLNSLFNANKRLFVPGAPKLNVSFEKRSGDVEKQYYLNWNEVTIANDFRDGDTKYTIFGDKSREKNIVLAENLTANTLNLTQLVESGILNSEFTRIYAVVQGNDSNILNGKTSNIIEIEVLNQVAAKVVSGEVRWDSQASASAYEIVFQGGQNNNRVVLVTSLNNWNGFELEEGYSYPDVTIKALGTQFIQQSKLVLAGPATNIGELVKLDKPVWFIEDGLLEWQNIANSTAYESRYYNSLVDGYDAEPNGTESIPSNPGLINYVSELTQNVTYFIKSTGTADLTLSGNTSAFISSNYTQPIHTFKHSSIKGITCQDGVLVWDSIQYNDKNIRNYILSFIRSGEVDIIIDIQALQSMTYDGYSAPYTYDGIDYSTLIADGYKLTIQGYAKGNSNSMTGQDTNFAVINGGKVVYALRSLKQTEKFELTKLQMPTQVVVANGSVTWKDVTSNKNSVYELSFKEIGGGITYIKNDGDRKNEFNFDEDSSTWTWTGYINKNIANYDISSYTLSIRRLATTTSQMNSDFYEYRADIGGILGEFITITQLNAVEDEGNANDVSIRLKEIGGIQKYVISWENYLPKNATDSQISYLFEYYTIKSGSTAQPNKKQIYVTNGNKYVVYEDLQQEAGTDLLVYSIQILAGRQQEVTLENYLNSRPSKEFTVEKPTSVKEIIFDTTSQRYEWSYENKENNTDLQFIINDYYIPLGTVITNIENIDAYASTKTVRYLTVGGGTQSYYYAPLKIGTHVINIEVSTTNAYGSDFKSGAIFYENILEERFSEVFNLYKSGEGTELDPYLIETAVQFNNIKYRAQQLEYLDGDILKFRQIAHLTVNCSIITEIENITYNGFMNETFNAVYDGNYYSLTLNTTLADLNTNGGLFKEIGQYGEVKNLHLLVNIVGKTLSTQVNVGLLAKDNRGTISNCQIGDSSKIITIEQTVSTVQLSMVAHKNYGIIQKVQNFYNVYLCDDNSANLSILNLGIISYENNSTIFECGNHGNISVGSQNVIGAREGATIGGIVARQVGGNISDCFNDGNITISYSSINIKTYFVGGIAGYVYVTGNAVGGNIWNCYTVGTYSVHHNNTNPSEVQIGGLVGKATDAKYINNCYSNVELSVAAAQNVTITANIKLLVGYTAANNNQNAYCYALTGSFALAGGAGLGTQTGAWVSIKNQLNLNDNNFEGETFANTSYPKFMWENDFEEIAWKS